jgi:hybrid cluster-associated redox disulfide protein
LRTRKDTFDAVRDPQDVTRSDALQRLVFDVLAERPAAARVFIERGMGCVGCTFGRFETVAEGAAVYGCDAYELACSLTAATEHAAVTGECNDDDH